MFFQRTINKILLEWKDRGSRKPLVLRGARQVGKTSAIKAFAEKEFKNFIYINLEKSDNLDLFKRIIPVNELIQLIELKFRQKVAEGETIIFFDEIQNSPIAMTQLRYFYEELPKIHIVAAGSLLEVKMKQEGFSFPVGRVEYCYMYPATFQEFLIALNETEFSDYINDLSINTKIPVELHEMLIKRFREYMLVGGMPEAVARYSEERSFIASDDIYESILTGFKDDVYKYSKQAKTKYIQYVIEHVSKFAGLPIKYEKFGGSSFKSREISEAFDILEKSMILHRVYAATSRQIPLMHNLKKSSKVVFLDAGLMNYQLGLKSEVINATDLNVIYNGQLSEQIVGQTLLTLNPLKSPHLTYWYRDKKGSTSEIDFLIVHNNRIIPLEVKSGSTGKLKSLHVFMEESDLNLAVRVYSGNFNINEVSTSKNKKFTLISMPFYLLHRVENLIERDVFPSKT